MRINLRHLSLRSQHALDSWIENQVLALGRLRVIDEANVQLVRHEQASPPYEVRVHLVTPGPDIFAEGRDHSLRAAVTKALEQVRATVAGRASKKLRRLRSQLTPPALPARMAG